MYMYLYLQVTVLIFNIFFLVKSLLFFFFVKVGCVLWILLRFNNLSIISRLGSRRYPIYDIEVANPRFEPWTLCSARQKLNYSYGVLLHHRRSLYRRGNEYKTILTGILYFFLQAKEVMYRKEREYKATTQDFNTTLIHFNKRYDAMVTVGSGVFLSAYNAFSNVLFYHIFYIFINFIFCNESFRAEEEPKIRDIPWLYV